ncbi:aminoglycoside phosphotransferase [Marinitenerispora sediminis]|uniref:Aminoglycoside phosphotransferase n=1 Tax=Marinitenerispora sediminis TaxID=1931232 RepID=A0A368T837_9ACTN|nr:aminoglycoside phosphotransferase [Marinitenerispora sediminis]RCV56024.1 aminoglycoside phosphotransferase [Marinitenerispora sediminis]RCV60246.1 aminoglycoside phosphotransferase [Marinitenerispora sediminis]RCV60988.1 aminoglycoside phosphotransferase [Marinitenerispora sediminis]
MSGDASYLSVVAEVLWPCGVLGRGRGRTRHGDTRLPLPDGVRVREYLPVPSAQNPRVILPVADRYAAARGISAFAQRHSFRQRVRTALLTTAFTSGLAPLLLRDRVRVASGPTIEHALAAALDREVVIAIHVGPPRANRKPVLLLLTPGGRKIGYAKVGVNPLTSRLVTAETAALRRLADARLRDVTVPRLVYAGDWNGRPLLVQEALPVGDQTDRPTRRQLLRCVAQIAGLEPIQEHRLSASPYRAELHRRITALAGRPEAPALRAAVEGLPDLLLPFGAWHGDLTRWNIASTPRRAFVWDWERLASGVPVGLDALHYELTECVQAGVHPGVHRWLDSGSRLLRDPLLLGAGLRPDSVSTVMALYLVDLATRYLQDRQAEAGARLAAVHEWLLPALAGLRERAAHEARHAT